MQIQLIPTGNPPPEVPSSVDDWLAKSVRDGLESGRFVIIDGVIRLARRSHKLRLQENKAA